MRMNKNELGRKDDLRGDHNCVSGGKRRRFDLLAVIVRHLQLPESQEGSWCVASSDVSSPEGGFRQPVL